jgi:hypothetical protein
MLEGEHLKVSLEKIFDGRDVGKAVVGRTEEEVASILK